MLSFDVFFVFFAVKKSAVFACMLMDSSSTASCRTFSKRSCRSISCNRMNCMSHERSTRNQVQQHHFETQLQFVQQQSQQQACLQVVCVLLHHHFHLHHHQHHRIVGIRLLCNRRQCLCTICLGCTVKAGYTFVESGRWIIKTVLHASATTIVEFITPHRQKDNARLCLGVPYER